MMRLQTQHTFISLALLLFVAQQSNAASPSIMVFPLVFHVASSNMDQANKKIDDMLTDANAQYLDNNIQFIVVERRELPETFRILENNRERHQVKRFLQNQAINIFVTDEILDPNPSQATRKAARWQNRKPSGRLAGAHINAPKQKPNTYILIAGGARNNTLPHELGHFFGLPHHRDPVNIMSYGAKRHEFTERQRQVIKQTAKKLIQKKQIRLSPHQI